MYASIKRTLSDRVRLDISVVVLAGPDESSVRLHRLSDHVVNETMLIPDAGGLEFWLVLLQKVSLIQF